MHPFRLDLSHGIILCKVRLCHRRHSIFVKLAVDTGASLTMISVEAALAIGLEPAKTQKHIEITTANGIVYAPVVNVPTIECFGVKLKDLEAVCHNLPSESPVEGLLGLNFLSQANVIIDFSKKVISVFP